MSDDIKLSERRQVIVEATDPNSGAAFRDAIYPDDENMTEAEVQAEAERRVANWLEVIAQPVPEPDPVVEDVTHPDDMAVRESVAEILHPALTDPQA